MFGGQPAPVVVTARVLTLQVLVVPLGLERASPRLLQRLGHARRLLLCRSGLTARLPDLPAQPGEPLGPHRGGPGLSRQPPFRVLKGRLGGNPPPGCRGQLLAGGFQPLAQFRFLITQARGLAIEFVRVTAGSRWLRPGRQVRVPLGGEVGHPVQALGHGGQFEPCLLGPGQARRILQLVRVERRLALAGLGQAGFQRGAPERRSGFIALVPLQVRRGGYVLVGQQPQPRVAEVRLDERGPAGDGRLAPEWLEAAAQFGGEVHQPGQVDLHRLELAQRLLLAPAVLEDPRGLLDQRAPGLRAGVQHLVKLALAHDDVHLAAQARVREEFLDVQQAAVVTVDRVLALARAEEQPADRHLGVIDGQGAVAVVDGYGDLGPAQWGPGRGPGEDDVLHLAAAQVLHALLAHHPGERVNDVGLARPVGADDAGDTGFEPQRGGGGERLEPAQGEGLQVHLRALLPVRPPSQPVRTLPRPVAQPGDAQVHGERRRNADGATTQQEGTPEWTSLSVVDATGHPRSLCRLWRRQVSAGSRSRSATSNSSPTSAASASFSSWSRTSAASRSRTRCCRRRISETMRGSSPPTWPSRAFAIVVGPPQ